MREPNDDMTPPEGSRYREVDEIDEFKRWRDGERERTRTVLTRNAELLTALRVELRKIKGQPLERLAPVNGLS